jgi:hypothetical protein
MRTSGPMLASSSLGRAWSSGEIMPTYVSPNWKRGFWRAWAILSSLWAATMTGTLAQYVFLVVRGEPHSPFQHVPVSASVIIALGPPAVLFALALAGMWIARRLHPAMLNLHVARLSAPC